MRNGRPFFPAVVQRLHDRTASVSYTHLSFPMSLGAYSWVCARASVSPGVNLGEGAVLGLGSVATRDLAPWTVYGGIPAQPLKQRVGRAPVNTGP